MKSILDMEITLSESLKEKMKTRRNRIKPTYKNFDLIAKIILDNQDKCQYDIAQILNQNNLTTKYNKVWTKELVSLFTKNELNIKKSRSKILSLEIKIKKPKKYERKRKIFYVRKDCILF